MVEKNIVVELEDPLEGKVKALRVDEPANQDVKALKQEAVKMFGEAELRTLAESERRAGDVYRCKGQLGKFLKRIADLGWTVTVQDFDEFPVYRGEELVAVITGEVLPKGSAPYREGEYLKAGAFDEFLIRLPGRVSTVHKPFDETETAKRLLDF